MLRRRSIRLKNYDYSKEGAYFITICTFNRQAFFGQILDGKMHLNVFGEIAKQCWLSIPDHYPDVALDEWVIMPDHIHGIIIIQSSRSHFENHHVGVENFQPLHGDFQNVNVNRFQHIIPRSIGCIIRGFKIGVTKKFRVQIPGIVAWQRNYYEQIIRNEEEFNQIKKYIIRNPKKWWENNLKQRNRETEA